MSVEDNAEKKQQNKIAEDENGQKRRRPPVMEAVEACLERVGLPARTSSPVTWFVQRDYRLYFNVQRNVAW